MKTPTFYEMILLQYLGSNSSREKPIELFEILERYDAIDRWFPPLEFLNNAIGHLSKQNILVYNALTFKLTDYGLQITTKADKFAKINGGNYRERYASALVKQGYIPVPTSAQVKTIITQEQYDEALEKYHQRFQAKLERLKHKESKDQFHAKLFIRLLMRKETRNLFFQNMLKRLFPGTDKS